VNTDARTITNITLMEEYAKLHDIFGWDETHFFQCNLNAIRAAFLPETMKQRLESELRERYERI
jgi:adenosine deaminase